MSNFIDFDLINAYVPEADQLSPEEAMKVATRRDEEAAKNLEMSVLDSDITIEVPMEMDEKLLKRKEVEALIKELYG